MPEPPDFESVDRIIFAELVDGVFRDESRQAYNRVIARLAARGCDAVALACTEIPLLVRAEESPLPTLDSTRLLARAGVCASSWPHEQTCGSHRKTAGCGGLSESNHPASAHRIGWPAGTESSAAARPPPDQMGERGAGGPGKNPLPGGGEKSQQDLNTASAAPPSKSCLPPRCGATDYVFGQHAR